jgi:hypothetical protein
MRTTGGANLRTKCGSATWKSRWRSHGNGSPTRGRSRSQHQISHDDACGSVRTGQTGRKRGATCSKKERSDARRVPGGGDRGRIRSKYIGAHNVTAKRTRTGNNVVVSQKRSDPPCWGGDTTSDRGIIENEPDTAFEADNRGSPIPKRRDLNDAGKCPKREEEVK